MLSNSIRLFVRDLDVLQKAWWNNSANAVAVGIITDYLEENTINEIVDIEAKEYAEEIITAVTDYLAEYGNTSETSEIATDFVRSILDEVEEEEVENVLLQIGKWQLLQI